MLVDATLEGDGTRGTGRTNGQALDIDGVTHLTSSASLTPGTFVNVQVTDAGEYDLEAVVQIP